MSIATKLQTVYNGVEDVRDALQEIDPSLGRGTISTLGDDIRTLSTGSGYEFQIYGDVRSEEEVEVEDPTTGETTTETEYTYTKTLILNSVLGAKGDDINTDVIDGIGELSGDMENLASNKVKIPLNTGVNLIVDATKTYVKFRDPIVENIVLTNWGSNGKITLSQVRAIRTLNTYFRNTSIETFNELKWFDGLTYNPSTGAASADSDYPFYGCTNLKEIKLPRVVSLGTGPFYNCTSLTHIEIPNTFTNLGRGNSYGKPYFYNTQIEEIIIPDSVTTTSYNCFNGMPNLKRIVWGKNLLFPRNYNPADIYPYGTFFNCPNLEKIEGTLTPHPNGANCGFNGNTKLDYTNILPLAETLSINTPQIATGQRLFEGSNIFDYAQNGIVTFPNIPQNPNLNSLDYLFNNSSEYGFTMRFPNWTEGVSLSYCGRVGRVELSANVTSMYYRFYNNCTAAEWILPCSTPPALSQFQAMSEYIRVFVPESAMSAYLADSIWSQHEGHLKPIIDPSTAQFCSIPNAASIPDGYTKVQYISNIDGDGIKNCQIDNLGYYPKRYSQYIFDFSHKSISESDTSYSYLFGCNGGNYNDFMLRLSKVDYYPAIERPRGYNANYPNRMGLTLNQRWYFNSHVTGEAFGKRSLLKMSNKWIEYHGLRHKIDEVTADSPAYITFLRYNNNEQIGRQIKVYRFCIFEPIENAADYDDPANYEIVRDYVPVMRNSDGVYGLYERLTNTFYNSTVAAAPFSGPAYE